MGLKRSCGCLVSKSHKKKMDRKLWDRRRREWKRDRPSHEVRRWEAKRILSTRCLHKFNSKLPRHCYSVNNLDKMQRDSWFTIVSTTSLSVDTMSASNSGLTASPLRGYAIDGADIG